MPRLIFTLLTVMLFASCTENNTTGAPEPAPSKPTIAIAPSPDSPPRCRSNEGEMADIDGDGEVEAVYHAWVNGRAQVGVCFRDGKKDALPGLGQAETMLVLREDVVDRDVILFGATGMTEVTYRLAIWKRGRLRVVANAQTNQPLEARAGVDAESGVAYAWGWNCDRINAPGTGSEVHGTLVQVEVTEIASSLKWSGRGYNWRNTDLASSDSARRGNLPDGDPLAAANHLVKDCRAR